MKLKKNRIPDAIKMIQEEKEKALLKAALIVEGGATKIVPVDTGRLKASITHRIEGDKVYVGTNVVYGAKIEYGGSKKAPQGYLRPSLYANEKKIREILIEGLKGLSGL